MAALACSFCCLVLTACRADVEVALRVEANGHGRVSVRADFDNDAAQRLGDLGTQLDVADLRRAGWTVTFPRARSVGGASVVAARAFGTPEEATAVLSQLTGANGPFRDVRLRQSHNPLTARTTLSGTLDLRGGLDAFGDEGLLRLTGSRIGLGREVTTRPAPDDVRFHVRALLPGAGLPFRWDPHAGESAPLAAQATSTNVRGVLGVLGAIASLGGLIAYVRRSRSAVTPPA